MTKSELPAFKNESQEADWWASRAGRAYLKRKSAEARSKAATFKGSALVDARTLAAIRKGRAEILRGEYSDLTQVLEAVRKPRRKRLG